MKRPIVVGLMPRQFRPLPQWQRLFPREMGMSVDKDMTPEEAAKVAGKAPAVFMKAMQEQAAKQAQEPKAKEE